MNKLRSPTGNDPIIKPYAEKNAAPIKLYHLNRAIDFIVNDIATITELRYPIHSNHPIPNTIVMFLY